MSAWVWISASLATCSGLTVMEFRGHSDNFWLSWGSVCCSVGWEHECGRVCSLLKFHFVSQNQHSWFVVVWPCVNDRICVRTWTIPNWTEGLTFPDNQVMHARGAGAMTQELVIACFIQALHIAPKRRPSNIQFPKKKTCAWFWTGFPGSRSFEWKTSRKIKENRWKTSGQRFDNCCFIHFFPRAVFGCPVLRQTPFQRF